ncbi:hypothetical protein [Pseudomonas baetica]|uniref:hypothetical protein n=1 Tax=Pseudomonas baetica TaxID=674054 RepID=UPI0024056D07|nr:hypothetical protein [Pseudomonas baetica]MDF9778814.1 hypothetical protein [Pseudomonas baetica]
MSDDKKSGLGDLVNNLKNGLNGMKGAGKNKAEPADPTITEDFIETESASQNGSEQHDQDDLLVDPQGSPNPDKKKPKNAGGLKNLSAKKKALLCAVALIGFFVVRNAMVTPQSTVSPQTSHDTQNTKAGEMAIDFKHGTAQKGESNIASSLPSPLGDQPREDDAVGNTLDELNLDEQGPGTEAKADLAGAPKPTAEPAALDAFGFPAIAEKTVGNVPAATTSSNSLQPKTVTATSTEPAEIFGASATPATPGTPENKVETNPFGAPKQAQATTPDSSLMSPTMLGKTDPVLAGTQISNPDSSNQPRLQGNSGAEMALMGAQLKAKDELIKSLEKQLEVAKNDKPAKAQSRPAKPKAVAPAKNSPAIAKRTPQQIKPVAMLQPRPKVCVKAVAPAARNCTTCVAHAFIVDSGAENMVGQGDNLHGYRVSITGDRLDLQDSTNGQVMHKFWSQPNGCAAF